MYFGNSFANYKPSTCYRWFDGMTNLEEVDGISYLNTSNVTRMDYMFRNCSKLTSLNLSTFNTQNVTTMYAMFDGCSKLTSLNVSGWSNTKVTEMALMFDGCSILTSLNLSNFKTPSAKTMSCMFLNCKKLTSINVSSFTTSNVTTFYRMFDGCNSLTSLDLSGFNAAKITSSDGINFFLNGCYALKTLKLSESLASCSYYTDYSCSGIGTTSSPCTLNYPTSVSLSSSFSTITADYVKWKGGYFKSSNMHGYAVFNGSSQLTFYYNDNWSGSWYALNTGSNEPEWFSIRSKVKTVWFNSSFQNARPTSCYEWFYGMKNLTTFHGGGFLNTSKVTNMESMFEWCTSLTDAPVDSYDTSNVTNMYAMFFACSALTELDLSSFNLSKLTNSLVMMEGCSSLKTLTIPSTANRLDPEVCKGVGTTSNPCVLNYPSGFTLTKQDTGDGWFKWRGGYFIDDKAYVNLSSDKTKLTFYYDKDWQKNTGTKNYSLNTGNNKPEWLEYAGYVTTVIFTEPFANARPTSCYKWFCGMTNLKIIFDMVGSLNTSQVTTMASMFEDCNTIENINVSSFNTAKVQTFEKMFKGCSKLADINVSSFNTSNVQTYCFNDMFAGCSSLTSLDISKFVIPDPVQHEDGWWLMEGARMMKDCTALKKLTIPSTANNLYSSACEGVGTQAAPCELVYPSGFTPKKSDLGNGWYKWKDGYFWDDNLKSSYAFLSYDSKKLHFFYDTYRYTRSLGTVYALNTGTNEPGWYSKRSSITSVTFWNEFADAYPTTCYKWFDGMENLSSIDGIENLKTDIVDHMEYMFQDCKKLKTLDISGFTLSSSTTTTGMLKNCSSLTSLTIPSTANYLTATACTGVGTKAAPCKLIYPSGFTPEKTATGNGWYKWKDGYFKDESQPSQFALGDVNHDGSVTVVDASLVTEYVLGKNPPVFFIENADVSHDGDVTVTDVSKIIEMVLTGSASIAPSTARESIGKSGQ
ncbi:MAG: BspA family leucine-rich repeat surface protein [Prevotella sp.]|nr:BspA family leucine-rich repeat surface protein [Prevotella sp.]